MQAAQWQPSTEMHTVELLKSGPAGKDGDEAGFHTREEALEYAEAMLRYYGYRVWVNGVEHTINDFKKEKL